MAREVTLVDAGLGNLASVERALLQVGAAVRTSGDPDKVATARMVVFPGQGAFGSATRALVEGALGDALRMVIERGDPFLGICLGMQLLFDGSDENGGQQGLGALPGWCRRFPTGMVEDAEPGAVDTIVAPHESVGLLVDATLTAGLDAEPGSADTSATVGVSDVITHAPVLAPPEPEAAVAPASEPAAVLQRRVKVPHVGWNAVEPTGDHYYFVHSYYVEPAHSEHVMWMATYGSVRFAAAVRHQNVLGCQFHPEKSQRAGLKFLRAFLLGGWG
jgi:imidazoleglycerol phosphate synthase glutamine amidotransferase subunit HisH